LTVFNDISRSQSPFQTKMTDFGLNSLPLQSEDLSKLLKPIISASQLPLDFYKDRCLRCGRPLVNNANRYNIYETKKKRFCPDCNETTTLGFNRGSHVPLWAWDRVLFSTAKGQRNVDIQEEVLRESKFHGAKFTISVPTIYKIRRSSIRIVERFEPYALRYLASKHINGTWSMDIRYHDLPFDPSLFPGKVLDPRKGNPHMYVAAVIHEEAKYCFSTCVSKWRDKFVGIRALSLAIDRAGVKPEPLKIDSAKELIAASKTLLSPEKILCINKKDNFTCNQAMEGWFGVFGLRHNKHECQYKRPETQECDMNIFRDYRNFVWPFNKTKKTPAETLGLILPRNIGNKLSFIPLLDFAYRFTRFVEGESARAKNKRL
jgi:hypothetical protein